MNIYAHSRRYDSHGQVIDKAAENLHLLSNSLPSVPCTIC